ncbi:MAG: spore germination protein, partial [Thermaerobacter sp.]|nr:spore germination protein [Thermaerobacter sp.]
MAGVKYKVHGKGAVQTREVSANLETNLSWVKRYLGYKESFDILIREFDVAGHQCALVCVDTFIDSTVLTLVMQQLQAMSSSDLEHPTMNGLLNQAIPYVEVAPTSELDAAANAVLAGPAMLLIDGVAHAVVVDVRKYPDRNPSEPSVERVLRGPHDGFVET